MNRFRSILTSRSKNTTATSTASNNKNDPGLIMIQEEDAYYNDSGVDNGADDDDDDDDGTMVQQQQQQYSNDNIDNDDEEMGLLLVQLPTTTTKPAAILPTTASVATTPNTTATTTTTTNHRLVVIDAIRVIGCFIILCGHVDMLFRRSNKKGKGTHHHRFLLLEEADGENDDATKHGLKCITTVVVQTFFNIVGFVLSYQLNHNTSKNKTSTTGTTSSNASIRNIQLSLLSRPFRLLIPLVVVQCLNLGIYWYLPNTFTYYNYQKRPPSSKVLQQYFHNGLQGFLFASILNGRKLFS